jgi:glucokinase
MAHFFGIDIGGSNIKIGLVDSENGLLEKVKYPTKDIKAKDDFIQGFSVRSIPKLKK